MAMNRKYSIGNPIAGPRVSFVLLCALLSAGFFLPSVHAGDEDLQLWLDQRALSQVSERSWAHVKQSFRLRDDAGTLGTYHIEGGLAYQMCSLLDLGLFYRHVFEKTEDEWLEEQRPFLDATLHWTWFDITFSDRSRFEYRWRQARDDKWRYRNKLGAVFPLKWTDIDLRPYIAGELFFDERVSRGDRSRVRGSVGIKTHPPERLRARAARRREGLELTSDFYLAYQSTERDEESVNDYIIGTQLGLAF